MAVPDGAKQGPSELQFLLGGGMVPLLTQGCADRDTGAQRSRAREQHVRAQADQTGSLPPLSLLLLLVSRVSQPPQSVPQTLLSSLASSFPLPTHLTPALGLGFA